MKLEIPRVSWGIVHKWCHPLERKLDGPIKFGWNLAPCGVGVGPARNIAVKQNSVPEWFTMWFPYKGNPHADAKFLVTVKNWGQKFNKIAWRHLCNGSWSVIRTNSLCIVNNSFAGISDRTCRHRPPQLFQIPDNRPFCSGTYSQCYAQRI